MLIPWEGLLEQIRPYYPKAGKGRAPYGLASILQVHCVQLFYNISDPTMDDMLYEIERVRCFTGIRLTKVPDEGTILNFRHLLERHGLGQVLFESIKNHLASGRCRSNAEKREDSGYQYHCKPPLEKEPQKRGRPREAADQKGEPVALGHEAPHGSGCSKWPGP